MTTAKPAEIAYTIAEAAEIKRVSESTLKRAMRATTGNILRAKKIGRQYRIPASALEDWFSELPDA